MFPQEARLRNLTYSAPLYLDITKTSLVADPRHPKNQGVQNVNDMHLEQEGPVEELARVFIGKVPIMLRSTYCILTAMDSKDLPSFGECPYDQVGVVISVFCKHISCSIFTLYSLKTRFAVFVRCNHPSPPRPSLIFNCRADILSSTDQKKF